MSCRCQAEMLSFALIVITITSASGQSIESTTPQVETWTGRWLPERLPAESTTAAPDISDEQHSVKMGISSPFCDDAQTNLTLDWDFSPSNFTCFSRFRITPDVGIKPLVEHDNIPRFYVAQHKCMDQSIEYDTDLPTFGTHRPLWPRYGEYKFVPPQRWIHSLEHGGIVALYHPCANPLEVSRLRFTVSQCLWRHIISPSNLVDPERPFVLLAWGWRLSMPTANSDIIQDFIKDHALRGPEAIAQDGQYEVGLLTPALIVTTPEDKVLCP